MHHNSVHYQYKIILIIAYLYKNKVFYLPTFADFRGRVYPLCSTLSYQGNDLARALLGFYNPKGKYDALSDEGLNYVYHYAANVAGHDKLTRKERVILGQELTTSLGDIFSVDNDNTRKNVREMLNNYNEPFQFLNTTFTHIRAVSDKAAGVKTYTNQAILFDATCNGTQH